MDGIIRAGRWRFFLEFLKWEGRSQNKMTLKNSGTFENIALKEGEGGR